MRQLVALVGPMAAAIVAGVASSGRTRERTWTALGVPRPAPPRTSLSLSREDAVLFVGACLCGWIVARAWGVVVCVVLARLVKAIRVRRAGVIPPIAVQERVADSVGALAAAVRSGASLPQAIRYAADEAAPPVREELKRVVVDLDTGVALDAALTSWAARHRSSDTDLVVGALELHRRSGGDLPAVLDQVVTTIRDRVSVAREVRSLTAQARLSAWILGLLPVGFLAFLWLTSRRDIEGALSTPVGLVCILLGLILEGGAFLWIRSLLEVT
jgi:Flp pilus assembly protein TadB